MHMKVNIGRSGKNAQLRVNNNKKSAPLVGSVGRRLVRFRLLSIVAHVDAHWADVGQEVKARFALRQSISYSLLLLAFARSQ